MAVTPIVYGRSTNIAQDIQADRLASLEDKLDEVLAAVNCLRHVSATPSVYDGGEDNVIGPTDREEGGRGDDNIDA